VIKNPAEAANTAYTGPPEGRRAGAFAMNTVPFTLDRVWGGFGEGTGLLHDEGTHLVLEYELQDGVFGAVKTGVKRLQIPFDDLVSVTMTKGWLGASWLGVKIVIQTKRLDTLNGVPGASQGKVELSIARKNHQLAEKFVDDLHENDEAT
jgi:hypothetical protein